LQAGYYVGRRLPWRPGATSTEVVTTTLYHRPLVKELVEVREVGVVWKCRDDLKGHRLHISH
jgi:hypothetical protein